MKKQIFAICSIISLSLCLSSVLEPVSVQAGGEESIELTILNQNVAGLPVKALFEDDGKFTPYAQVELGKMLNAENLDIVCVQEDFQYHDLLAAQMTNYPYQTYTSGGIPMGDGLNIYSKYPIYNVVRVAWNEAYGALTNYCDELTPKGFLKVTVDVKGTLIDLYDLHHDGGNEIEDNKVRHNQILQLTSFIKENSKENPVILVGDFNSRFSREDYFYKTYIQDGGFKDAWVECYNNGNYFQGEDASDLIEMYKKRGGYWDNIERIMYKSSSSVDVNLNSFDYKYYTKPGQKEKCLTDHKSASCKFEITKKKAQSSKLEEQKKEPIVSKVTKFVSSCGKSLKLIVKDAVRLLFK